MDRKPNYHRLCQCKKPHKKTHIRREIARFSIVCKMAIFGKMAKGGPQENFQKWPIFWVKFGRLKNKKYKSHRSLISMDRKRNYHRLCQCKKPHEKTHIRREIARFSIVCKMAIFGKMAKGGPQENFQKWPIFWVNFGRLKNKKYKSHRSLISMDRKRNYHRLCQCKKPHKKTHIRREIARFSIVCKMAIFGKMAKGGPQENFQKWPIFGVKFGRLKNKKYKSHRSQISMDRKRNYHRLCQCKKAHEKTHIRREIARFSIVCKMAIFGKMAKGGPQENFQKWPIFWVNFGRLKNKKYKSHRSLISMDRKRNYHRLCQCKKPHKKNTYQKRNSTFFNSV